MSWRDQLRKASFRGAAFFVDTAEGSFGRRAVVHEYPLRDKPYVEDLGRKADTFTVEAFVLAVTANNSDYMPARDALIAALKKAGPGTLVHPYLGELRVALTESKLRESTKEGGIAHFTLTFVESGEPDFPAGAVDTAAAVDEAADAAIAASQTDFTEVYDVGGAPDFVATSSKDLLKTLSTGLNDLTKLFTLSPADIASFAPTLFQFTQTLDDLIRTPITLAGRIVDLVGRAGTTLTKPIQAYYALKALWKFGLDGTKYAVPAKPDTTPSRRQDGANQGATLNLVGRLAVIEAARYVPGIDFSAVQDALALRDEISDELDRLMEGASSIAVYQALTDLRSAVVRDINARHAGRLVKYTPMATLPALALAYDLYTDAKRDGEIVARNRVRHPGFVPGGRALEVLADA